MTHTVADAEKSRFQTAGDQPPRTSGIVLHSPILYDITVWLAFLGREHSFREKVLLLGMHHLRTAHQLRVPSIASNFLSLLCRRCAALLDHIFDD